MFLKLSRRFGFSTKTLGHVMFSFAGTAQEAGAGGRSGAAGIPVHGSLTDGVTTRCQCVPQTREHSMLHPHTPERQDAERQEVWGHMR